MRPSASRSSRLSAAINTLSFIPDSGAASGRGFLPDSFGATCIAPLDFTFRGNTLSVARILPALALMRSTPLSNSLAFPDLNPPQHNPVPLVQSKLQFHSRTL